MRVRKLSPLCALAITSGLLAGTAAPALAAPGATARRAAAQPGARGDKAKAADEAKAADKAKAKKLFAKGSQQYRAGQFTTAITTFREAYRYWKNPRILLNIAICHFEAGDRAQAVTVLREALASLPPDKRTAFREKLPDKLVKAEQEAGALTIRMPGEGAEIAIDGKPAGTAPLTRVLMPGPHEVVITEGGEERARKTVEIKRGAKTSWVLTAWPEATDTGEKTEPGDDASGEGFMVRWRRLRRLPIWYFGAAAALAVAGGITVIATGVKTNQLEDDYLAQPTVDTRDEGIRYRTATNAMVGITVTAVVAAGVLAAFTDWKNPFGKKERALRITPQIGAGGGGLAVSGRF